MVFSKAFSMWRWAWLSQHLELKKRGGSQRTCWGGILLGAFGTFAITPDAHLPFCVLFSCSVFLLSIARHGADMPAHQFYEI